jgi:hypothetical protein
MSRGLGRFQHQLLCTAAAIAEVVPEGADLIDLQMFWTPPPAHFDHANIYRGLHALARRGLVWMTDQANYGSNRIKVRKPP